MLQVLRHQTVNQQAISVQQVAMLNGEIRLLLGNSKEKQVTDFGLLNGLNPHGKLLLQIVPKQS